MTLIEYIKSLSISEQDRYAEACNTTGGYLRAHIKHARKTARPDLMIALAENSGGNVQYDDVICHFYKKAKSA